MQKKMGVVFDVNIVTTLTNAFSDTVTFGWIDKNFSATTATLDANQTTSVPGGVAQIKYAGKTYQIVTDNLGKPYDFDSNGCIPVQGEDIKYVSDVDNTSSILSYSVTCSGNSESINLGMKILAIGSPYTPKSQEPSSAPPSSSPSSVVPPKKSSNTTLYVIVGVIAVIIFIAIIVYIAKS